MDTDREPVETIQEWQRWYKQNELDNFPSIKEKPTTKDTSAKEMWIEKAKDHFADTLAEYQYELSGKDFYKAFYQAAYENAEIARKEYERAKELVDMLRYHHLGEK